MRKKIKTAGHWLFENGYPALFWSGLTVGMGLVLFESYFQKNSCALTKHYHSDAAKKLFWGIFATRLIALPLLVHITKKVIPDKLPSHEIAGRLEVEFNDGIETALFVFETMMNFKLPIWFGMIIAIPSFWPIFCSIYKFFNAHFVRGPKENYAIFETSLVRKIFTVFESLYNTLSLASATSFLTTLLFNVLYNSTHKNPFKQEGPVLLGLILFSGSVGAVSVYGKKPYKIMCYSEAFINTLYYSFNIITSSAMCEHESSFTDTGFIQTGWIYVLIFGIACLGLALIGGFHGVENPYVEEEDLEEEDRYALFAHKEDGILAQRTSFSLYKPVI